MKATGLNHLTYLNTWSFLTFNAYLTVAAVSTTTSYLSHYLSKKQENSKEDKLAPRDGTPECTNCAISKCQIFHWALFTVGAESAFAVSILYWILLYQGGPVSSMTLHTHLINGLAAILDVWVSGIPVSILHATYLMLFGLVFTVFTGIYYIASGNIIYETILNYRESPGSSVALALFVIFLFLPVLHISCFYMLYLVRCKVVQWYSGKDQDKNHRKKEHDS